MNVEDELRTRGYRLTTQRRAVWEVLCDADRHLPVDAIHQRVMAKHPDVNLVSVYRTLTLLAELGLAKEVHIGDGRGHWELAHDDDAFHLVCRECGEVSHHAGSVVEDVRSHLGEGHGFAVEHIALVVHGVCERCESPGSPG